MPLITARNRQDTKRVPIGKTITAAQKERLSAYAKFVQEDEGYVIGQMIEFVIEKDRDFQAHIGAKHERFSDRKIAKTA